MKQYLVKRNHLYHIINPAPWPFYTSISIFNVLAGFLLFVNKYIIGLKIMLVSFFVFLIVLDFWFLDIIRESSYEGKHTRRVRKGLRQGMLLFIISEIMFFFSFFWGYFHFSLSPALEIGCIWPPYGIQTFNYMHIPLYNTFVLLFSGVTITASHKWMFIADWLAPFSYVHRVVTVHGNIYSPLWGTVWRTWRFYPKIAFLSRIFVTLLYTIILAFHFTYWQVKEYIMSSFNFSDGAYGSIFFMATGFHGFHVLLGTMFLIACLIRLKLKQFSKIRQLGFQFAAWYWHFVDVVWIFLFIVIYYGSNKWFIVPL